MARKSATTDRAALAAREKLAGNRLPYLRHVDDMTVETRDGMLMQVIHIQGLPFETLESDELDYRKTVRESVVRALGSSRFAVYHHVVRREVVSELGGTFPDEFSRSLDEAWTARLGTRRLFANDIFITLMRRPLSGRIGMVERLGRKLRGRASNPQADIARARDRRELDAARESLLSSLTAYNARLLTVYESPRGPCSEVLEFLSALYDGRMRPMLLPHGDLGRHLPTRRISFGPEAIELGRADKEPNRFCAILSIKDYPAETMAGLLDDLYRLPFELTVSQSFALVDRQPSLERMNLVLRRMRAADDEALSLRAGLAAAKDDVAAGRALFGEHHLTVAVWAATLAELDAAVGEAQSVLTDTGIIAVREDINLEAAYWAQFPGNFKDIARRALISTGNFAGFASGHNFPLGRAQGNHWGQAVTLLETTAAGPYHFNFHKGDLGNFTIIGPSGSGKTVVLSFLLAQARRFAPRIVYFDKDRGAEIFVRAMDGRYEALKPGQRTRLNPLLLPDTAVNRRFLAEWLGRLMATPNLPLTTEDLAEIEMAIDASYAQAPEMRRLRYLIELFRGARTAHAEDLAARLAPWVGEGQHAWLFDNAEDGLDLADPTIGFDLTAVLDDPAVRTASMMYLFHRVEERLDGTPTLIVVDEGWKALDDDVFVARIRDWEKTIRKRNGVVGFATQSASDALSSRISSAIIEQAATQIFMVNPKAQAEEYITGFGLTRHEYDLIRSLPESSHAFLIKHGRESVVARLDLSDHPELLTVLSGRERTVRLLDAIRDEVGDAPSAWLPRLLEAA
ncbi:VirB4 family type IV secretion/conjugal transfer ATPase [Sphingomonas nostoxanthinifaciens]|uniref:VirB4 family type IV secretion/conjugal transfer ATPase n=1 Tax=Sphingomonas nostoxanthinifaciens TaxID=2872652 RepID=UPI001CC20F65|nr:VirB4 family type IV secretion/conjugal transfer ATPase [Sphingomonas nostoxanthinifaciens]UAK23255.1 VirB4 family type IV secretion/conjugal transfer ATPase [Sphingomonas nostoxanthinifaciens]